jgi:site-specific DNA recombinase
MKLLAAIRLSRETDETTSPDSQRKQITGYSSLYGHEVVANAIDLDVKGSVSPFEREQLGPYLTDSKLFDTWDGIIVSKLDRLGRSVVDFASLLEWCRANNKTVISVAEHLDFSTAAGVMFANALIAFAQFERERMAERRRDAAKTLRETGRWGGGQVAFGYRPQRDGNGWILVKDSKIAGIAEEMADRIIAGEGLSGVSRWLNENEVPTPRKTRKEKGARKSKTYQWWPATVRDVLRSRSLLGEMTHNGATVLGSDGMPLRFEPIITDEKWVRLQTTLDAASNPLRGERRGAAYLLRVVYCACGEPLYQTNSGAGHRYYRCRSRTTGKPCGNRMIPMAELETAVDDWITTHPTFEITETRIIHGNGNAKLLADVGQQIADLTAERYVRGIVRDDFHEIMARLQTEYDRLAGTERKTDRIETIPTGRFLSEEWSQWDEHTRRRYLQEQGFRFIARRNEAGGIDLKGTPGEEYRDKVADRLRKIPHPRG